MRLETTYLGQKLTSPFVPSACQALSDDVSKVRQMEDAGAGAVVLYSVFEEQLRHESLDLHEHVSDYSDSFSEAQSFFPEPEEYRLGPEEYLRHLSRVREAVGIPVIASLNGSTLGGWTGFARELAAAGANALELNIYRIPTDPSRSSLEIEEEYLDIVRRVTKEVQIPVAVKLSPYFTNLVSMASRLDEAGANGLVLFNRFYQPDIDLEELDVRPDIILSNPLSLRLPLRWIAILFGRVEADLAATSGIHKAEDAVKVMMAGASAVMLCSVLLRYGISHIQVMKKRLLEWMDEHEYDTVQTMQGSMSQARCENPSEFERAQYIKAVNRFRPKRNF